MGDTVVFAFLLVSTVVRGVIFSYLWEMFIVPTFHAPPLTTAYAVGMMITAALFTGVPNSSGEKKTNAEHFARGIVEIIFALVCLVSGCVVKTFFC